MAATNTSWVDQLLLGIAGASAGWAQAGVGFLMGAFGDSTEPDLSAVAPIYDRMLAVALLLVGAVIALGLIERILGGQQGLDWNLIPRTLVAVFIAFAGLNVVEYLAHYAALLATTWGPDMAGVQARLHAVSAQALAPGASLSSLPLGSVGGLILTAVLTTFLALLVYLELVLRGALLLLVTSFLPLVCLLSIWPRLAGAATALAEFLVGLLLSKFVIATTVYVGFALVIPTGSPAKAGDWMVSGLAILTIAAYSPVALAQALRFTHSTAGTMARGFAAESVAMTRLAPLAGAALRPITSRLPRRGPRPAQPGGPT